MIILNKREEKCLQCLAFIGTILIVANEALYRVIDKKVSQINKENIKNSWME